MKTALLPGETARFQKSLMDALTQRYLDILRPAEARTLAAGVEGLSGIFLPSVSESYVQSPRKIMIVGKETRGWARGLKFMSSFDSLEQYVAFLVGWHQALLVRQPASSKFFQFYRQANLRMVVGSAELPISIIWANLFCVSWHGKSPTKVPAPIFDRIKQISRDLLKAQIEILRPDVILFVTGPGYDCYLKEWFEIKESRVIEKRSLWQFKADGIQAYRTTHPQWEAGSKCRSQALDHIFEIGRSEPFSYSRARENAQLC